MLRATHVMAPYWHDDREQRTSTGRLLAAAKDGRDVAARDRLGAELAEFATTLDLPPGCLVAGVPPAPGREGHIVPALAAAVAAARDTAPAELLVVEGTPARLRDTPPEQRAAVVAGAGYRVIGEVVERAVVLVDDVVLTGTTLDHLAGLLVEAGATSVDAVVACRTRRR